MNRSLAIFSVCLLLNAHCARDIYAHADAAVGTVANNSASGSSNGNAAGSAADIPTVGSGAASPSSPASGSSALPPPPTGTVLQADSTSSGTAIVMSPPSGPVGTTVSLHSPNLQGITSAHIGGVSATFFQQQYNLVEVQIPAGATSAPIVLNGTNGVLTTTANFVVTSAPSACGSGGFQQGGHCYYMAALGQGCSNLCVSHNGYAAATRTVIGSQGSDSACAAVAAHFGYSVFGGQPDPNSEADGSANGRGCDILPTGGKYERDAVILTYPYTTDYTVRRLCACNM